MARLPLPELALQRRWRETWAQCVPISDLQADVGAVRRTRGPAGGRFAGERRGWGWAARRVCAGAPPPQATPPAAFTPALLPLWGGADRGGWAGPWFRGWPRPRGLLLVERGRPPHAVCLLARACGRRAPLVCSDLGTKFKDFKSTSWRLLRATARRRGRSPLPLRSPPPHLRRSPRSPA